MCLVSVESEFGVAIAWAQGVDSLPEFMIFKLVGKTILVVNIKFELFLGYPLRK